MRNSQTIIPNSLSSPVKTTQNNNNKKSNQKKWLIAGVSILLIIILARNKIKKWFKPEIPKNNKPNSTSETKPKTPKLETPNKPPENDNQPEIPKTDIVPDKQYIENLKLKIKNAKNYYELKAAESEAETIQQSEIKQEIISQINSIQQQLIQQKKKENCISQYEVAQMMDKFYQKQACASESNVNLIKSRLGEKSAKHFKNLVETPIQEYSTILSMTTIANKCNGKYLNFWKENPELLKFYTMSHENSLIDEQISSFDEKIWDIIIYNFIKSVDGTMNQESLDSILKYGRNSYYDNINGLLRINNMLNKPITQENLTNIKNLIELQYVFGIVPKDMKGCQKKVLDMIDIINNKISNAENIDNNVKELKSYIKDIDNKLALTSMINNIKKSSYVLEEDINVIRTEKPTFLRGIKHQDMDACDIMLNARNNPEIMFKLETFFKDGGQISVIRPEFLSTSIPPYSIRGDIATLNIKLKKGVEYTYISDLKHCFDGLRDNTEAEILVMPGHKMTITNVAYKPNEYGSGQLEFDCVVEKNTDGAL